MIFLVALALLIVVVLVAAAVADLRDRRRPPEPAHLESSEPREAINRTVDRKQGVNR